MLIDALFSGLFCQIQSVTASSNYFTKDLQVSLPMSNATPSPLLFEDKITREHFSNRFTH